MGHKESNQTEKMFDTLMVFLKEFFEKIDFEKKVADDKKKIKIYPVHKLKMTEKIYSYVKEKKIPFTVF